MERFHLKDNWTNADNSRSSSFTALPAVCDWNGLGPTIKIKCISCLESLSQKQSYIVKYLSRLILACLTFALYPAVSTINTYQRLTMSFELLVSIDKSRIETDPQQMMQIICNSSKLGLCGTSAGSTQYTIRECNNERKRLMLAFSFLPGQEAPRVNREGAKWPSEAHARIGVGIILACGPPTCALCKWGSFRIQQPRVHVCERELAFVDKAWELWVRASVRLGNQYCGARHESILAEPASWPGVPCNVPQPPTLFQRC